MQTKGSHVIADVWLDEFNADNELLRVLIDKALYDSGMQILDVKCHEFEGGGFTGVWLLAESHFSIHTFPERNYMSIDCYTCGACKPLNVVNSLLKEFSVDKCKIQVIGRG